MIWYVDSEGNMDPRGFCKSVKVGPVFSSLDGEIFCTLNMDPQYIRELKRHYQQPQIESVKG